MKRTTFRLAILAATIATAATPALAYAAARGGRLGYNAGMGRYGRNYGFGYGGFGGYGGYGYGGLVADVQQEGLHERQMQWSTNFAPIPEMPPAMTVNPNWNPYQSHLGDDVYHRDQPAPKAETITNPFFHPHAK